MDGNLDTVFKPPIQGINRSLSNDEGALISLFLRVGVKSDLALEKAE